MRCISFACVAVKLDRPAEAKDLSVSPWAKDNDASFVDIVPAILDFADGNGSRPSRIEI